MAEFFAYAVDRRLAPFWLPFGVRPSKDGVTITDEGTFRATYGFFRVETPLSNIDDAHVTRDYRWWTAAGARGSLVDDGLTFGTNRRAGASKLKLQEMGSRYLFIVMYIWLERMLARGDYHRRQNAAEPVKPTHV